VSSLRCLLLDMGKVLIDFTYLPLGMKLFSLTGLSDQALHHAIVSDGLVVRFERGDISIEAFHSEICRRFGRQIPFDDFSSAWNSIFLDTPILQEELIASLAGRVDLWVVSNTNRLHFEHILKRYSFLHHFRGYIVSYELGAMKPDPRIYEAALRRAGVRASEALFVDDLLTNVEAARDLGIDGFQFVNPEHFAQEMRSRALL